MKNAAAWAASPECEGHRADPTLEVRDPLLEGCHRRVHDPRIRVAVFLQVEIGRRRIRILEDIAGRLEDRGGARPGVGLGPRAGVHGSGGETGTRGFPLRLLSRSWGVYFLRGTQESANEGGHPTRFQQEGVVSVPRVDLVMDHALLPGSQRGGESSGVAGRV